MYLDKTNITIFAPTIPDLETQIYNRDWNISLIYGLKLTR